MKHFYSIKDSGLQIPAEFSIGNFLKLLKKYCKKKPKKRKNLKDIVISPEYYMNYIYIIKKVIKK